MEIAPLFGSEHRRNNLPFDFDCALPLHEAEARVAQRRHSLARHVSAGYGARQATESPKGTGLCSEQFLPVISDPALLKDGAELLLETPFAMVLPLISNISPDDMQL